MVSAAEDAAGGGIPAGKHTVFADAEKEREKAKVYKLVVDGGSDRSILVEQARVSGTGNAVDNLASA